MEDPAWRIDTLDARGGLAFVSWRHETLFDDAPLEEATVFFIGAPAFAPQPVANRGVALAAERQGFQLGLLDENGEIPFESLDDVAEAIRRLYLAAARGDPADPTAAPPLPLPEGGPPGLERLKLFDEESVEGFKRQSLAEAVTAFRATSAGLARGLAQDWTWTATVCSVDETSAPAAGDLLVQGAVVLLAEVLSRFPNSLEDEALERWRVSAIALAAVCRRLDLWRRLRADRTAQQRCNVFRREVWSRIEPDASDFLDEDAVDAIHAILLTQSTRGLWSYDWTYALTDLRTLEPMDDLARLPLPLPLAKALKTPNPDRASLSTLTSVGLGSPECLAQPDAESLLLFAAARIVSVDGAAFLPSGRLMGYDTNWDTQTGAARQRALVDAARAWIAANLPRVVFPAAVEAMFNEVGAPTATTPTPAGGSGPWGGRTSTAADEARTAQTQQLRSSSSSA